MDEKSAYACTTIGEGRPSEPTPARVPADQRRNKWGMEVVWKMWKWVEKKIR